MQVVRRDRAQGSVLKQLPKYSLSCDMSFRSVCSVQNLIQQNVHVVLIDCIDQLDPEELTDLLVDGFPVGVVGVGRSRFVDRQEPALALLNGVDGARHRREDDAQHQ